jgi:hypothetical protein
MITDGLKKAQSSQHTHVKGKAAEYLALQCDGFALKLCPLSLLCFLLLRQDTATQYAAMVKGSACAADGLY